MKIINFDSLIKNCSSLFIKNKHSWQTDLSSEQEVDLGIGMEPAKQFNVSCKDCGIAAIKTVHPLYGTSIIISEKKTAVFKPSPKKEHYTNLHFGSEV